MSKTLSILTLFLITIPGFAQDSEVGMFAGTSYYLGDINSVHFRSIRPAGGFIHRYIFNPHFAVKNSFLYGMLYGDDSKTNNASQIERNLHFKSSILDVSTHLEFNFFPFEAKNSDINLSHDYELLFTPYVFAGISLFSFNPKARFGNTWYDLQPLGTEGQGTITYYPDKKKYSLTQLAIPFGGGIKIDITEKVNIGFEWGLRASFTDYIDDISTTYPDPAVLRTEKGQIAVELSDPSLSSGSENTLSNVGRQRGNSKNNDWYSFAGVMIVFKLKSKYIEVCPAIN